MNTIDLAKAYCHCQSIARQHYENFPVASLLLQKNLRKHVAAIYAFARQADDLADEGEMPAAQRITALDNTINTLYACLDGMPATNPVDLAISHTIKTFNLPVSLFSDLISAFRQDVTKKRYADFAEVLNYCQRSANPIGRLMLHLYDQTDADSLTQSDAICSALQLINFFQDLQQDYHESGRIYIPQQEMTALNITDQHFADAINDAAMRELMQLQYQRAAALLQQGAMLGKRLSGRFGLEIRLIIAGGQRIVWKLNRQQNLFLRPRLTLNDKLWMLYTALLS